MSSLQGPKTPGARRRTAVMADVAKLAAVSLQTVSRVLHDSPQVRRETRERVLAAIRRLGYRPNSVAQALVTGRSGILGVVSFDTTLYGPASTLLGIEEAAHDGGYGVSIASLKSLNRASVLGALGGGVALAALGLLPQADHCDGERLLFRRRLHTAHRL